MELNLTLENCGIAVIGLGYVGLPLAVELSKKYQVNGFDTNSERIEQLVNGHDSTLEFSRDELSAIENIEFTSDEDELEKCNVYIVTVPTPIDSHKRPDLAPLKLASSCVGQYLSTGNIVIYESTVYPGATEEVCAPILADVSGLSLNQSFFLGYSPERINPGDKSHRITDIVKVTSGSTTEAAQFVDELYQSIICAGTHRVSSIKVAEAAKIIENTQRDINIALINELAMIFNKMGLNTNEVLNASASKWNFLPFRPGLVGGHCIGVDPYYLTHKAQGIGHNPEVILAGRKINDSMGSYIALRTIDLMESKEITPRKSAILIMGLSFKENCPDIRNTRIIDIIDKIAEHEAQIDVYDPWVDRETAETEFNISLVSAPKEKYYDAIIIAVAHDQFKEMGIENIQNFAKEKNIIFDVKGIFPSHSCDGSL